MTSAAPDGAAAASAAAALTTPPDAVGAPMAADGAIFHFEHDDHHPAATAAAAAALAAGCGGPPPEGSSSARNAPHLRAAAFTAIASSGDKLCLEWGGGAGTAVAAIETTAGSVDSIRSSQRTDFRTGFYSDSAVGAGRAVVEPTTKTEKAMEIFSYSPGRTVGLDLSPRFPRADGGLDSSLGPASVGSKSHTPGHHQLYRRSSRVLSGASSDWGLTNPNSAAEGLRYGSIGSPSKQFLLESDASLSSPRLRRKTSNVVVPPTGLISSGWETTSAASAAEMDPPLGRSMLDEELSKLNLQHQRWPGHSSSRPPMGDSPRPGLWLSTSGANSLPPQVPLSASDRSASFGSLSNTVTAGSHHPSVDDWSRAFSPTSPQSFTSTVTTQSQLFSPFSQHFPSVLDPSPALLPRRPSAHSYAALHNSTPSGPFPGPSTPSMSAFEGALSPLLGPVGEKNIWGAPDFSVGAPLLPVSGSTTPKFGAPASIGRVGSAGNLSVAGGSAFVLSSDSNLPRHQGDTGERMMPSSLLTSSLSRGGNNDVGGSDIDEDVFYFESGRERSNSGPAFQLFQQSSRVRGQSASRGIPPPMTPSSIILSPPEPSGFTTFNSRGMYQHDHYADQTSASRSMFIPGSMSPEFRPVPYAGPTTRHVGDTQKLSTDPSMLRSGPRFPPPPPPSAAPTSTAVAGSGPSGTVQSSSGETDSAAPSVPADLPIVREIQTSKLRVDGSRLTQEYFDRLTREATALCAKIKPTESEEARQRRCLSTVTDIVKSVFPDAEVGVVGGAACGVGMTGAEMDICVSLPDAKKHGAAACIERIGHALKSMGMKDVKMLTRARVPVVKMRDPSAGSVRCDIGIHSPLTVHTTRLLQAYGAMDPRVAMLVLVVKYWSKRRGINEPYFGTLSSYCYHLMVLHLLQHRGVLPCLQRLCPDGSQARNPAPAVPHPVLSSAPEGDPPIVLADGGHDIYFFDNLEVLARSWTCTNKESLGELVVAFFKYYSAEFPYVHGVASVRAGRVLSKEEKGWTKERQQELNRSGSVKDRFWLCVEDPFDTTHNVGRPIDKETLFEVRGEFIRASKILCGGPSDSATLAGSGNGGSGSSNSSNQQHHGHHHPQQPQQGFHQNQNHRLSGPPSELDILASVVASVAPTLAVLCEASPGPASLAGKRVAAVAGQPGVATGPSALGQALGASSAVAGGTMHSLMMANQPPPPPPPISQQQMHVGLNARMNGIPAPGGMGLPYGNGINGFGYRAGFSG